MAREKGDGWFDACYERGVLVACDHSGFKRDGGVVALRRGDWGVGVGVVGLVILSGEGGRRVDEDT